MRPVPGQPTNPQKQAAGSPPGGTPPRPPAPAGAPTSRQPILPRRPESPLHAYQSNGRPATPTQEPEDQQARLAFEQARKGERAAYGMVVRAYQHRLYNAVYRLVGNREDAAEITQEAFTRGFEKLSEFRGDSGPYTWLFRIAMNAAVSRIRTASRRRTLSLEGMDANRPSRTPHGRFSDSIVGAERSPSEVMEMSEAHRAVAAAMEKLNPEHRALLVMRDLEGFDYRQMADVLGLPLGTLKSRLFRARMALRELLEASTGSEGRL